MTDMTLNYHLHYILSHPWRGRNSFSFIHVTSPDMLHWTWQPTQRQPAFTGHGMFSGTGFLTTDGRPAVTRGEDISCPNFFPIGDWDAKVDRFIPTRHGRMNWRREGQSLFHTASWRLDFFAPESLLTPDGSLRIRPLRELETLRQEPVLLENIDLADVASDLPADRTRLSKVEIWRHEPMLPRFPDPVGPGTERTMRTANRQMHGTAYRRPWFTMLGGSTQTDMQEG